MKNLKQLTERQRAVYDFIRDEIRRRGFCPSVREICTHFGIASPNGVICHLDALVRKGVIRREPKLARAIQVI